MTPQYITDLPFGYEENTEIGLNKDNEVVLHHPVMPALIYDKQLLRWVELKEESNG
jgi:hypothetical protein